MVLVLTYREEKYLVKLSSAPEQERKQIYANKNILVLQAALSGQQ